MNGVMLLLANGLLLIAVLIAMLFISKKNPVFNEGQKVKEDIKKIKNQINGEIS